MKTPNYNPIEENKKFQKAISQIQQTELDVRELESQMSTLVAQLKEYKKHIKEHQCFLDEITSSLGSLINKYVPMKHSSDQEKFNLIRTFISQIRSKIESVNEFDQDDSSFLFRFQKEKETKMKNEDPKYIRKGDHVTKTKRTLKYDTEVNRKKSQQPIRKEAVIKEYHSLSDFESTDFETKPKKKTASGKIQTLSSSSSSGKDLRKAQDIQAQFQKISKKTTKLLKNLEETKKSNQTSGKKGNHC